MKLKSLFSLIGLIAFLAVMAMWRVPSPDQLSKAVDYMEAKR